MFSLDTKDMRALAYFNKLCLFAGLYFGLRVGTKGISEILTDKRSDSRFDFLVIV